MQVAVENMNQLERRMKVSIPASQVQQEVDQRLKEKARTAKINGFRPGKVPLDIIRRNFGEMIRHEVMEELIRSSFYEALAQEKLDIAGAPHIHPTGSLAPSNSSASSSSAATDHNHDHSHDHDTASSLQYEATFEVYPIFELKDLSGVTIEKQQAEVTDADLEKVLDKLRLQYADWISVERPAQSGDRLTIDFQGTVNGEKFDGGSAENVIVVLGSNSMIPGFEEGLIGTRPDSQIELNVTFPEEYPQKNLAGKAAKFAVKVQKIAEPKLPALDDDFAQKLDVKEGVAALREEVQKSMQRELERGIKDNLKKQLMQQLLKHNPIEIPKALIDAEIQQMQQQLKQRFAAQTGQKNLPDLPKEHFLEQAKERVTLGLLLAEFIKKQQIKVDQNKVRAMLEEIASAYDNPGSVVNYYFQNKSALAQIEAVVMEEQAVEKLLETAQVEEKKVSYDEIVNPVKS